MKRLEIEMVGSAPFETALRRSPVTMPYRKRTESEYSTATQATQRQLYVLVFDYETAADKEGILKVLKATTVDGGPLPVVNEYNLNKTTIRPGN